MGYNTDFYITVDDETFDVELLREVIKQRVQYFIYTSDENFANFFFKTTTLAINDAKWYEFEDDIEFISTFFPDKLIIVKGFGEDYDDIWITYAINGVSQKHKAEIVYSDFIA